MGDGTRDDGEPTRSLHELQAARDPRAGMFGGHVGGKQHGHLAGLATFDFAPQRVFFREWGVYWDVGEFDSWMANAFGVGYIRAGDDMPLTGTKNQGGGIIA